MRKCKLLALLAVGLILVSVRGVVIAWREFNRVDLRVSYGDYRRVERGMSHAEVESILGGLPETRSSDWWGSGTGTLEWEGCAGSARVAFDDTGKVVDKEYLPRVDWDAADSAARERIRNEWRKIRPWSIWPRQKVRE
jgi:hypothetical protein